MPLPLVLSLVFAPAAAAHAAGTDPFAGVTASTAPVPAPSRGFLADNFGLRWEIMSQFEASDRAAPASRQSLGFETLKKFSTETRTWASADFQGRLARRDRYVAASNEAMGMGHPGWTFEYHNAYADFYDVLDPLLDDASASALAGRVNARAGHFYVPFGLNLRTDTHATILQLSNEKNFGFERDWYAGLWGHLSDDVDYDADYLAGSGDVDLKYRGQSGLGAARLSLSNRWAQERGLEGGLSFLGGERLADDAVVNTTRGGADGRWRFLAPGGSGAWTSELSGGRDDSAAVFTQLHQLDYLSASRRWGLSTQYRRFWRDGPADSSVFAEATWYFRNDVGNSSLHWIKLNVERQLERVSGPRAIVTTLQYYRYW